MRAAPLLLLCVLACGERDQSDGARRFPAGFLFGTAIAGFQADMGCPTLPAAACVDAASDWYRFTTDPEVIADPSANLSGQDPMVVGPGFWELYEQDLDRARDELGNDALRLSLEWSRIFPRPTDGIEGYDALKAAADPAALARYHAIFAAMKARGLTPLVTLNHYALPTWIHDPVGCHKSFATCSPRGWVDRERTVREIAKYAGFCAREFGAEVDLWATLNEPLQNVLFGYLLPNEERTHPPAVTLQTDGAKTAIAALIEAHARMVDALRAGDTADADGDGRATFIGLVYPITPVAPRNPDDPVDVAAVRNIDYLWNRAFLNAVAKGDYDEHLDGTTVHREDLAGRMDYIGINWYFTLELSGTDTSILPSFSPLLTINPFGFGFADNTGLLAEALRYVNQDLGLPAIITENGTPDPADDGSAPRYLVRNLDELERAMAAGADVRGYFYWTLMDNYEWNHGMDVRMGLYAVAKDDASRRRVARKTVPVYAAIAGSRTLPEDVLREWLPAYAPAP